MKERYLLISLLFYFQFNAPAASLDRDYAIMTATPYNSEIALARERLEKFLEKASRNPKRQNLLAQNPLVAVEAYLLTAGEVSSILRRMGNGSLLTGGEEGESLTDRTSRKVQFLLLFDTRTRQLVSTDGFLVVNTPSRGKVGTFGGFPAIYIGAGW